jgi:adenylosuccinate lyase
MKGKRVYSVSPLDDRYYDECFELAKYFSEKRLLKERVDVEVRYLKLLQRVGVAPKVKIPSIYVPFERFKEKEKQIGHDVKAVELCIREALSDRNGKLSSLKPFVHLGLTSEDVNSVAFGVMLKNALDHVIIPSYELLLNKLLEISRKEADTVMVARTHGKPALPTTFGKEISVFAYRLNERLNVLKSMKPAAKVSGAVGTYASFFLIRDDLDWPKLLKEFVSSFGLDFVEYTTQIVPGERLSDILHVLACINQLMIGLARDLWMYQALGLVSFSRPGKVSSSTMPQKNNPVDLEDAEGQAEVANSLLIFMTHRFQLSRLQRDLSDSPIRRNIVVALAHSLITCKRMRATLDTMNVERKVMSDEISRYEEIFAEPVQLLLRLNNDEDGYEKVKKEIESGRFSMTGEYKELIGDYTGLAKKLAKAVHGQSSDLK